MIALPNGWRTTETIGATLAVPLLGVLAGSPDPLFLRSGFPWLVLVPLVVALRHGWKLGIASFVMLDLMLLVSWRTQVVAVDRFPVEPMIAICVVSVISGKFAYAWTSRVAHVQAHAAELQERKDALAHSHVLLSRSHERLDEQLEHGASSLRDAVAAVTAIPRVDGTALLEIFASYCGVISGELFVVEDESLGESSAVLGRPEPVAADDPVVGEAIRTKNLVYVTPAVMRAEDEASSVVFAAVPFVHAGTVRALLCIHAMSFMSFQQKNFETMAAIAAFFAAMNFRTPVQRVSGPRWKGSASSSERVTEIAS